MRQAVDDNLGHEEFLYRLLNDEVERREQKQLEARLRRAAFESDKTLENFDFQFNPKVPRGKLIDLGTCVFVAKHENVLMVGPTGVGKSHVAQALGHRACRLGHDVLYVPAHKMLGQLRAGRADNSYDRKLARLANVELLIIDDLGLHPLRGEEPADLYEIIRMRYEVSATVVTSNRSVEEWYPLFGDELLASAAMDRLLHHAHVVVMEGKSHRNPGRDNAVVAAA
jgi:DNA replication protein DnaC